MKKIVLTIALAFAGAAFGTYLQQNAPNTIISTTPTLTDTQMRDYRNLLNNPSRTPQQEAYLNYLKDRMRALATMG